MTTFGITDDKHVEKLKSIGFEPKIVLPTTPLRQNATNPYEIP